MNCPAHQYSWGTWEPCLNCGKVDWALLMHRIPNVPWETRRLIFGAAGKTESWACSPCLEKYLGRKLVPFKTKNRSKKKAVASWISKIRKLFEKSSRRSRPLVLKESQYGDFSFVDLPNTKDSKMELYE